MQPGDHTPNYTSLTDVTPGTVFPPRLFGEKTMRTIMCKT